MDEGAGNLNGIKFKQKMSDLAAHYNFSAKKDEFTVNIKSLSNNFEDVLELIIMSLTSPKLDQESIKQAKNQQLISLSKKLEQPNYVAAREWGKIVFGAHPYKNPIRGRKESIENITKVQIQNYVDKHLTRDNLLLSVVGDITKEKLRMLINAHINKIPLATENPSYIEKFVDFPDGSLNFIYEPIAQTVVMFGQKGLSISDPDFYPLHIFNYILAGGGFESRLMEEIREKEGLAYSVFSYLNYSDKAQTLEGFFATKHDKAEDALKIFTHEINKLKKHGISEEELKLAKDYSIGSFPLKINSYEKLVNYLNFMQSENLGTDFLETRNERVRSISLEDIDRVIDKVFNPEKMTIVVVGQKFDGVQTKN